MDLKELIDGYYWCCIDNYADIRIPSRGLAYLDVTFQLGNKRTFHQMFLMNTEKTSLYQKLIRCTLGSSGNQEIFNLIEKECVLFIEVQESNVSIVDIREVIEFADSI